MVRVKNIKLRYGQSKDNLLITACKKLKISPESVQEWSIFKESLDVRKKEDIFYIYTLDLKIKNENKDISYIAGANHNYTGKEEELGDQIVEFIKKNKLQAWIEV